MNPGISYLYEYENSRKLRNVGFIKITRHYQACTLHIHMRNIPVGSGDFLEFYAFYNSDDTCITKPIGKIPCENKAVSAKITIPETHFPDHHALTGLDGFLLKDTGGRHYAALSAQASFHTNKLTLWQGEPQLSAAETETSEENAEVVPETAPEILPEETSSETPEVLSEEISVKAPDISPEEPEPENTESLTETEVLPVEEQNNQTAPVAQENTDSKPSALLHKIQRTDLSRMPRKFGQLAANSFLMHGHQNYNHLLLVEENGQYWLGVPGIYDVREAKAAELFGFGQFTDSYVSQMDLSEEERSPDGHFGYWFRYIG